MSTGQRIVVPLLIGAVLVLLQIVQRRRASMRNGWHYLTPGPMVWAALILGFSISGVLSYIYLFVGSSQPDADFQMKILLLLTSIFDVVTLLIAYGTVVEEVRWDDFEIQRRTLSFGRRRMTWHQLAAIGVEANGYWWIKSPDGPKIRFSPYNNGFRELLRKIANNLPTNLPPAEANLIARAIPLQSG